MRQSVHETLRSNIQLMLDEASFEVEMPITDLVEILGNEPETLSKRDLVTLEAVTRLADRKFRHRRYTPAIVNGFYASANRDGIGESTFLGGFEALELHDYPRAAIDQIESAATSRFLGLGNVWRRVDRTTIGSVVDVGCGAGVDLAVAYRLIGKTANLVGFDKRGDLLELAKAICPVANIEISDIEHADRMDREFDLVIANGFPPLQRPDTLPQTATQLLALAGYSGVVSATVIVAATDVVEFIREEFRSESWRFVDSIATLLTGKPTEKSVNLAFERSGGWCNSHLGANPYRATSDQILTDMVEVMAGSSEP